MENELLLAQAIELLKSVNPKDLEIVQIENTKYDDGSTGFNVSLTYPAKDVITESVSYYDGNAKDVAEITKPEVSI